ncbi:MAG: tRNA-(ms[2]io[6]A)-hydroxylase [Verrucomicrobiota bacterium]
MKYSLELTAASPPEWVRAVLADFPSFLQDHADCERKASAMALSFVAKYPDRVEIIPELIETAREELDHFQQVYRHMEKRGIRLAKEIAEDPYVKELLALCHTDPTRRFLDRLLLASIIECRGAERFRLVCHALPDDDELKAFYHELWTSEAKHGNTFVKMALNYFPEDQVYRRLEELNRAEGKIMLALKLRAALH